MCVALAPAYRVGGKTRFKVKAPVPSHLPSLVWPEQAGPERVEYNKQLRERYAADKTSLSEEDLARAVVLVERDARKRAKKEARAAVVNAKKARKTRK